METLNIPLVHDEMQQRPGEEEEGGGQNINAETASFIKTCFMGLNVLSGVGMLSIPYALSSGGWLSLIFLFIVAISTFYSGLLIQRCMDSSSDIKTYPDIGYHAFGNKGKMLVSFFINAELYLVSTGFLIVEGDNWQNLFPDVGIEILGFKLSGKEIFVVIVAIIILPSVLLDSLSMLSYISAGGILASAIILGSVLWVGEFDGIGFHQKGRIIRWNGISTSISLYCFCYGAHPVFPTLYSSMRNKHQFPNILLLCFILVTICNATMAIFGYLMFGSNVQSQITLNLPTDKIASKVALYTTLINPISKYALTLTPIVKAATSRFAHNDKRYLSPLISTALVISTVVVSLAFPYFKDLMSLVGGFLNVTMSIILPCLCYLKISPYRSFRCETVIIGCLLLMAVMVGVMCTCASIVQIIKDL